MEIGFSKMGYENGLWILVDNCIMMDINVLECGLIENWIWIDWNWNGPIKNVEWA